MLPSFQFITLQNETKRHVMFLGFCNLLFLQKEKIAVYVSSVLLYSFVFIRILFLLFCCFLLFFEIYSIFISFLLLKLIFTSGIIIIIQNVTYWYNYCFSKAVVIGDNHNHNHNHNHKCYNVYLFIYLSTQAPVPQCHVL